MFVNMSIMHAISSERPAINIFQHIRVFYLDAIWRHWEFTVPKKMLHEKGSPLTVFKPNHLIQQIKAKMNTWLS